MSMVSIVIFGCGMYVAGSSHKSEGPVLAAIAMLRLRYNLPFELTIILPSQSSIDRALVTLSSNHAHKALTSENVKLSFQTSCDDVWNSACQSQIRICVVCSPDYHHYAHAKWALQKSADVLVVKPAFQDANEHKQIIELESQSRGRCFVEYHKRWDPQFIYLRNKIIAAESLDVEELIVQYGQPTFVPMGIFARWSSCSNPFSYIGVHYVDLIAYLFDAKILDVDFRWHKRSTTVTRDTLADHVTSIIKWEHPRGDTFDSYIHCNWLERTGSSAISRQNMDILTNHWRFEGDQKARGLSFTETCLNDINPHYILEEIELGGYRASGYAIDSILGFLCYAAGINQREYLLRACPVSNCLDVTVACDSLIQAIHAI